MQLGMSAAQSIPPSVYSIEEELAFCRSDFSAFIEKTFKIVSPSVTFYDNWHLHCIAEYLLALQRRDIKRLIINIPPRSLKSISCSVAWPAWILGHDPSAKIMCASYSNLLSTKHSIDCRYLIESAYYKRLFPNTILADDNNQKTKYLTTMRGHRIATSVGGTSTGEGGNYLILDDPNSASDAQSKQIRTQQNMWIDQSWSTRLNDKQNDVMLVIQQRLHQDDATGHLLEVGGWEHLCLPARFESRKTISIGNFYRTVQEGEILHAEREDDIVLKNTQRQMGSYAFAGQYLQRPAPEEGGMFSRKWLKLYPSNKEFPTFECIIQSYDTAMTESTVSDYTAFTAWGVFSLGEGKGFGVLLLDCWKERLIYPDLRKKAVSEYGTRYGLGEGRRADFILIENKGSGMSLIQDMQRAGLPIRKYDPQRADKVQRLSIVSYLFEAGLVYLPESERSPNKWPEWCNPLVEEMTMFPNAEHDDYVDTTTQALRFFRDSNWLRVVEDPDEEDDETFNTYSNPYAQ